MKHEKLKQLETSIWKHQRIVTSKIIKESQMIPNQHLKAIPKQLKSKKQLRTSLEAKQPQKNLEKWIVRSFKKAGGETKR